MKNQLENNQITNNLEKNLVVAAFLTLVLLFAVLTLAEIVGSSRNSFRNRTSAFFPPQIPLEEGQR